MNEYGYGPPILLQQATPGVEQQGNFNISGTGILSTLSIANQGAGSDPTLNSNAATQIATLTGSLTATGVFTSTSASAHTLGAVTLTNGAIAGVTSLTASGTFTTTGTGDHLFGGTSTAASTRVLARAGATSATAQFGLSINASHTWNLETQEGDTSLDFVHEGGTRVAQFETSGALTLAGAVSGVTTLAMSSTLTLAGDVALSRGAANRLDLASGDSFRIVAGTMEVGGATPTGEWGYIVSKAGGNFGAYGWDGGNDGGAAADSRYWDIGVFRSGGAETDTMFRIGIVDDAYTIRQNILDVTRTGNTVTAQIFYINASLEIMKLTHSANTRQISFFGVAAQAQQATIVDADGTLADITTKFNTLLADLEGYGLLASA